MLGFIKNLVAKAGSYTEVLAAYDEEYVRAAAASIGRL